MLRRSASSALTINFRRPACLGSPDPPPDGGSTEQSRCRTPLKKGFSGSHALFEKLRTGRRKPQTIKKVEDSCKEMHEQLGCIRERLARLEGVIDIVRTGMQIPKPDPAGQALTAIPDRQS